MAGQLLGTNPALEGWAQRDRDRSQEVVTFFLETMLEAQKEDFLVRGAFEGEDAAAKRLLAAGVDPNAVGSDALEEHRLGEDTTLVACVRVRVHKGACLCLN